MSGIMSMLLGAVSSAAAAVDEFFNRVTLLLPGNGTNGAQNNTFLDSSTNNFTITRNGNTTQGTFSPFSQTGWSNFFDGADDFLQKTSPAAGLYDWTSTNWTLEFWIYANAFGQGANTESNVFGNATDGGATSYWTFGTISTGAVKWYYYNGGSVQITTTTTLSTGRWYHLAFVNNSNNLAIYIDGVSSATGTKSGTPQFSSGTPITLGKISSSFNGYISNLRITQSAVYTSNFTPSTTPLTAISGTQLLMCQSNRFVDNSTNAVVFTPSGTPSIQAFSPFAPTAAYSAATVGGSGFFDGTGDYLSVADNAALDMGGSSFTMEFWTYLTGTPSTYQAYISKRANTGTYGGVELYLTSGRTLNLQATLNGSSWGVDITTSSTVPLNSWTHVAVVRNGDAWAVYINGASGASTTVSGTVPDNSSAFMIGAGAADGSHPIISGYIGGFRVVKGTAVYTAAFTAPTAPLTNITNTQLLCNFTNAGITDATAKNDLETVGNAQISTTQSQFGGSSMYFDGTGDYLTSPRLTPAYLFQSNSDWTIEFWFYTGTSTGTMGIFDTYFTNDSPFSGLVIQMINGTINVYDGNSNRATTTTYANSTWHHFAWVNNAGTSRIYINGSNVTIGGVTSWTTSANIFRANAPIQIGRDFSPNYFTGYIDDLRITKAARYTANFTAPTTAFPLQ